jgi:hypothetical protein
VRITFPENKKHAAKATRQVFKLAALSPRVRRIYFYHWMPSAKKHASWDSALVDPHGKPRPAYNVVRSFIRKFARLAARRKAATERQAAPGPTPTPTATPTPTPVP